MSHVQMDNWAKERGVAVTNSNGVISVTPTTLNYTQLMELIHGAMTTKHLPSLVAGVLTFTPASG